MIDSSPTSPRQRPGQEPGWCISATLFGSVLRGDFSPDSDVDVLVTFHSSADCDYEHLLRMKEELERLFERPVDLVQRQQIENSDNYIRRKHILTNLETVYVA